MQLTYELSLSAGLALLVDAGLVFNSPLCSSFSHGHKYPVGIIDRLKRARLMQGQKFCQSRAKVLHLFPA